VLRACLDGNSEFRRLGRWGQFLEAMRAEDAPAVRGILREMESHGRTYTHERDAFWARWGEVAGEAAIKAVNAEGAPEPLLRRLILNGWARADAAGAVAWLEKSDENMPARKAMFDGLALGLSQTDPSQALDFVRKQTDPKMQEHLAYESIWGVIYTKGQKDAETWLDQLAAGPETRPETTRSVLSALLTSKLRGEPEDFMQYVNSHRDESWFDQNAVKSAWQKMASQGSPEKLLNAAGLLPEDEFRNSITGMAVSRFMSSDHNTVGNWLTAHRDSPLYDQVTSTYAMSVKDLDASAAATWAGTIKDESLRRSTLEKLRSE
jgi:hypothetical protein